VEAWTIPGLIDAHVHLTMDFGARTGLDRGSDALVRANGEASSRAACTSTRGLPTWCGPRSRSSTRVPAG
jgi:imidazolonepropionase-like amidohydrolase